jgi:hypothetical protein
VNHQPAPSFPPEPYYPPPPPPSWNGKTNGFSIAALALSLFGCVSVLSVVFGVIGLRQSRRNGDRRGRFYAIASLTICGLWLLAIAVAVVVNLSKGPDRDAGGTVRGERSISLNDLRAGDCVPNIISQTGSYVDVVPCTTVHNAEVIGRITLPKGPWPGEEPVKEAAKADCDKLAKGYTGAAPDGYTMLTLVPEEGDWPRDRGVLCIAYVLKDSTSSLRR